MNKKIKYGYFIGGSIFGILVLFKSYNIGVPYQKQKPRMNNKVVVITGSSSGIGIEVAKDLLNQRAKVIFACRNEDKTKKVIEKLKFEIINEKSKEYFLKEEDVEAEFKRLDLCDKESINDFYKDLKANNIKIDILINNSGVIEFDKSNITKSNTLVTMQTNFFGPMKLTYLLLELMNQDEGRIINVVSELYKASQVTQEDYKLYFKSDFEMALKDFSEAINLYSISNLGKIYFSKSLALISGRIKVVNINPGFTNTDFFKYGISNTFPYFIRPIITPIFFMLYRFSSKYTKNAAGTVLMACYEPYFDIQNGGYYEDYMLKPIEAPATDENLQKKFIDLGWEVINDVPENRI